MATLTNEPIALPASTTMPNTVHMIYSRALGSPALGTTTAVAAAVSAASAVNITTGITNPDVPRNVTCTTTGTAANVTAQTPIVTGTDIEGNALTETLPAFTAASNGTVTGSKAFATVTSVTCTTIGSGVNMSVGTSTKLGLPRRLSRDTIINAYLNGVREATRPTVAFDKTNVSGNTVILNSALNASAVIVDFENTRV